MADSVALILLIIGVALIIFELVIPGFGLPGLGGLAAIMVSIILYAQTVKQALILICIALAIIVTLFILSVVLFNKNSKFVLSDEEKPEEGYVAPRISKELIGKIGVTETDLHPGGAARIDGSRISVETMGEYISKEEKVKVVSIEAGRVKVIRED